MSSHNLKDLTYCIIDFKISFNEVIGIHALKVDYQGQEQGSHATFDQLVRPSRRLTSGTLRYFNLKQDEMERAPRIQEVYKFFKEWVDDSVLVSRFSAFEMYALTSTFQNNQIELPSTAVIDPFYMARYLHPRSWQKMLSGIYGPKKKKKLEARLKEGSQLTSQLLKEFVRKGKKELLDILPLSCPKPISRAYTSHHQILNDAHLRNVAVLIEYPRRSNADPGPRPKDKDFDRRKVNIYGFRAPFMVGYCYLRKAMRTFRIERIKRLQLLEENPYSIPEDFHLGSYFMSFHPGAREADLTTNIHFK